MNRFFRNKYILLLIFLIILGLFIYLKFISALASDNIIKCNSKFALCPAAKCVPNPNDDSQAYCFCDVKTGTNYSYGNNSCENISPYLTSSNQEIIFSDFSPIIKKMGYNTVSCPPEDVNLNCMNKICSIYPHDSTKAICICDKTDNQGNKWHTYNKNGEPKTCNYQSGAIYSSSIKMHKFIKENP